MYSVAYVFGVVKLLNVLLLLSWDAHNSCFEFSYQSVLKSMLGLKFYQIRLLTQYRTISRAFASVSGFIVLLYSNCYMYMYLFFAFRFALMCFGTLWSGCPSNVASLLCVRFPFDKNWRCHSFSPSFCLKLVVSFMHMYCDCEDIGVHRTLSPSASLTTCVSHSPFC